jgi:hypothetical protein
MNLKDRVAELEREVDTLKHEAEKAKLEKEIEFLKGKIAGMKESGGYYYYHPRIYPFYSAQPVTRTLEATWDTVTSSTAANT